MADNKDLLNQFRQIVREENEPLKERLDRQGKKMDEEGRDIKSVKQDVSALQQSGSDFLQPPFWPSPCAYSRSRMISMSPLDSATSVASPRAFRKASVPPRMPKWATTLGSGNGASPPRMICP